MISVTGTMVGHQKLNLLIQHFSHTIFKVPPTAADIRVKTGEGTLAEQVQRKSHYPGISNAYFNIHVRILDSTERIKLSPVDLGYPTWLCYLFSYITLGKSLSLSFFSYKMGIIFILQGESYTLSLKLKST